MLVLHHASQHREWTEKMLYAIYALQTYKLYKWSHFVRIRIPVPAAHLGSQLRLQHTCGVRMWFHLYPLGHKCLYPCATCAGPPPAGCSVTATVTPGWMGAGMVFSPETCRNRDRGRGACLPNLHKAGPKLRQQCAQLLCPLRAVDLQIAQQRVLHAVRSRFVSL